MINDGVASGTSSVQHGILTVSGTLPFYLEDAFQDVLDVLNRLPGQDFDVPGAQPYRIHDKWRGRFDGKVYADASLSRFVSDQTE